MSQRRRRWLVRCGAVVAVVAAATGITRAVAGGGSAAAGTPSGLLSLSVPGKLQPAPPLAPGGCEGVPVPNAAPLASRATMAAGQQVDGISCQSDFHLLFHWHAALTVFASGKQSQIPAGVGIIDQKETRNSKGQRGLPLSTDQVGPAKGHVTVFYDGKVYRGHPRDIPLVDKAQIQLDVGTPLVAPDLISFPKSL